MCLKISPQHAEYTVDKNRRRKRAQHRDRRLILQEKARSEKQHHTGDTADHQHISQRTQKNTVRVSILVHRQLLCDYFGNSRGNTVGGDQQNNGVKAVGRLIIPETQRSDNSS